MTIDRSQYIELYSITMEEVRHHHRLYTETWIGGIFVGGIFFTALRFLSGVPSLRTTPFMWVAMIVGSVVILTFYWVAMRRGVIAEACREIAKELENILVGKTQVNTSKLAHLLLTQEIEALQKQRWHFLRLVLLGRWLFLFILFVALWIYLCFTLFNG